MLGTRNRFGALAMKWHRSTPEARIDTLDFVCGDQIFPILVLTPVRLMSLRVCSPSAVSRWWGKASQSLRFTCPIDALVLGLCLKNDRDQLNVYGGTFRGGVVSRPASLMKKGSFPKVHCCMSSR